MSRPHFLTSQSHQSLQSFLPHGFPQTALLQVTKGLAVPKQCPLSPPPLTAHLFPSPCGPSPGNLLCRSPASILLPAPPSHLPCHHPLCPLLKCCWFLEPCPGLTCLLATMSLGISPSPKASVPSACLHLHPFLQSFHPLWSAPPGHTDATRSSGHVLCTDCVHTWLECLTGIISLRLPNHASQPPTSPPPVNGAPGAVQHGSPIIIPTSQRLGKGSDWPKNSKSSICLALNPTPLPTMLCLRLQWPGRDLVRCLPEAVGHTPSFSPPTSRCTPPSFPAPVHPGQEQWVGTVTVLVAPRSRGQFTPTAFHSYSILSAFAHYFIF